MTIEFFLRGLTFLLVFAAVALWEGMRPRRPRVIDRWRRWTANIGLFVLNTVALRLVFPLATIGMALSAVELGWGLFNQLHWPLWIEMILAVVILDLAIYWQHRLSHKIPLLWRLHRVHHADIEFDCTTALRFHTLEILLSMLYKWLVIMLIGPAVIAVLVFEVLLNAMAIFNHANASLPRSMDQWLRRIVVTPDMHRVHHSSIIDETNSNYGFNLSCWDHLFSSYRDQPSLGHKNMRIGLEEYQDLNQVASLPGMLLIPFTTANPASEKQLKQ